MSGKDFFFFITRQETESMLRNIFENDNNLHAALSGLYNSVDESLFWDDIRQLPLDLPLMRRSDNRFIIQKKEHSFSLRRIPQTKGGIKVDVDFGASDIYIYISFGGYSEDRKILLAGELVTGINNKETKYLFELFQKQIKKVCRYKFDKFYISDGAMSLYSKGVRLCDSTVFQDPESDDVPVLIKGSKFKN